MTENNADQPVLTDDEILQVFADAVGNQEDDARFIDVDRDQAIRIARTLLASAPVAGEAVACLRRQREGSDWGHWTPTTVEDGQRVTGLRSWQVRWLVDATPEAIADGLTVEIRLPNGTNISGWMKMASQAHLSAAPVECPPVAGERAFQLVQDLRAFAAMQRWFGEHGYDSVGASGRLAVSNALFARLCAALSAQPGAQKEQI